MTVCAGFVARANLSFIRLFIYSFIEQTGSECRPYDSHVGGGKGVSRTQEGPRVADLKIRETFSEP